MQLDHPACYITMDQEGDAYSDGYGKEYQQGVQQARDACEVVLVGNVTKSVGESHSRNQRYQGPDYHVSEALPESPFVEEYAEQCTDGTRADVAQCLGHTWGTGKDESEVSERSGYEGCRAVHETAAENGAEGSASKRRTDYTLP